MLKKYQNFKKSISFFKPFKKLVFTLLIVMLIASASGMLYPFVISEIILQLTSNDFSQILKFVIILIGIVLFHHFFWFLWNYFYEKVAVKVMNHMRSKVNTAVIELQTSNFDKNTSGFFTQRMIDDTEELTYVFIDIAGIIVDFVTNFAFLIYIFILNTYIGLLYLLAIIILYIFEYIRVKLYYKQTKKIKINEEEVLTNTNEMLRGIRDVKGLFLKSIILDKVAGSQKKLSSNTFKRDIRNMFLLRTRGVLEYVFNGLFILLSVFVLIPNGQITIAVVIIIYNFIGSLYEIVTYVAHIKEFFEKGELSASRIYQLIENDNFKHEEFGTLENVINEPKIEFKNVSFSYDTTQVFNNLNLKIDANTTVGFVGKSGSGKSSIFNMLTRFYDSKKGKITIDNYDIKTLSEKELKNTISVINQTPYIFNASIKENLISVNPNITDEKMIEYCKMAQIHSDIMKLPFGYDTFIGEGGVNLSGGQKQRLAIARALIKDSKILLFDEATNALDNTSQRKIQLALKKMSGTKTILIIAHRLSTITDSDKIFVIEDGVVLGEGTHNELLENCEVYKTLNALGGNID